MKVCVLGGGAWGTAISTLLANNNNKVNLWCYEQYVAENIASSRYNEIYLPGIYLTENVHAFYDLEQALKDVDLIFEAIPMKFLRPTLKKAKPFIDSKIPWVILTKGIEQNTLFLPNQVVNDELAHEIANAVLVGPSYARDLAEKQLTAVTLGVHDLQQGKILQQLLKNNYFISYLSTDIIGMQVGGALKNVIALAIGMLDGVGYKDNTQTFLLIKSIDEIIKIIEMLGGKAETFYGLSGLGDLMLTCMGTLSKNKAFGQKIAKGLPFKNLLHDDENLPEGINTLKTIYDLQHKFKVNLPIFQIIYAIVFQDQSIDNLLHVLSNE